MESERAVGIELHVLDLPQAPVVVPVWMSVLHRTGKILHRLGNIHIVCYANSEGVGRS